MTDKPEQIKKSHEQDWYKNVEESLHEAIETHDCDAHFGIQEVALYAEAQRIRAETAEQERDNLQQHLERIYELCAEETTGSGSAVVMQYIDSIEVGVDTDDQKGD